MYMDERAKERRDAQAVTDAKQEQSFVIKTGLSLTEAVIFSALQWYWLFREGLKPYFLKLHLCKG